MIRITRKRLIVATVVLLFLAGILAITWRARNWPPPRLVLRYGFPPTGALTGQTADVAGITFVQISAGYFWHESSIWGRDLATTSLDTPETGAGHDVERLKSTSWVTYPEEEAPGCWIEIPRPLWVSRETVGLDDLQRLVPPSSEEVAMYSQVIEGKVAWNYACIDRNPTKVCESLARHNGARFRLPSREEWLYAYGRGAFTAISDLPEIVRESDRAHTAGYREQSTVPYSVLDPVVRIDENASSFRIVRIPAGTLTK